MTGTHAAGAAALDSQLTRSEPKPQPLDAQEPQFRSIPRVIGLSLVTLCIGYLVYLSYQWARELNGLAGKPRHSPALVAFLSIITLGVAGAFYECIFAGELERHFQDHDRKDGLPYLSTWVIALNILGYAFVFTAVLFPLAIPVGLAATCLVQAEFNKLARR
jgi:hypothetical protein